MYDFAKERNFDAKTQSRRSTRGRTLLKLLKSPALMASGTSKQYFYHLILVSYVID